MAEKEAKGASGEDMISKLPDSLISQILSCLPTKEAVRTCVLSKRWKSLWLLIPGLDLDSSQFPNRNAFVGFMEKFIDFSREEKSCLHKLKLSVRKDFVEGPPCVTCWIDFVATPKLELLDVECLRVKRHGLDMVPLSLYTCETLLNLRLRGVLLGSFEYASLPCVKKLGLEQNVYANEACLELLISSCPVLEDLSIERRFDDNVKVLRVHSPTLTRLNAELRQIDDVDNDDGDDEAYENRGVLIDAPRLKYLYLDDYLCESKTVINSSSLTKVTLGHTFAWNASADKVRNFVTSISRVRDMKISWSTFELIIGIMPFSLRFCNITCLEVKVHFYAVKKLLKFLKSCQNLKSLILNILYDNRVVEKRFGFVPQCLSSSLEFVEIRRDFWGPIVLELARYFLRNSIILKELSLGLLFSTPEENAVVLGDLLGLPRPSGSCQITVYHDVEV